MRTLTVSLLFTLLLSGCVNTISSPVESSSISPATTPAAASSQSLSALFPLPTAEVFFDGLRVTFVGNEGVLISTGDKKILIDAIFQVGLPKEIQNLLVNADPPFDAVDLILVTHEHADHFDAAMLQQHLKNNPYATVISTSQVAGRLLDYKDRVITLEATEGVPDQVEVTGIQVKALYLTHGRYSGGAINLGYLITVGELKLFHAGDFDSTEINLSYLEGYKLAGEKIDVAFIPNWMLTNLLDVPLVTQGITDRTIIPIHYEYAQLPLITSMITHYYPDAIFFEHSLQSWIMPEKD